MQISFMKLCRPALRISQKNHGMLPKFAVSENTYITHINI